MADKDWNPDDLLDFHYDHEVPGHSEDNEFAVFDELIGSNGSGSQRGPDKPVDSHEEIRRYESLRHQEDSSAKSFGAQGSPDTSFTFKFDDRHADRSGIREYDGYDYSKRDESIFEEYDRKHASQDRGLVEVAPEGDPYGVNVKEIAALKQASQDAYDRYKSNYRKNAKKRSGKPVRVSKFHKWLTGIYTVAMAAFLISMTVMDVLPFGLLIALYVIVGLLSVMILVQTRKNSIKKWGKRMATFLAILLIFVYGMGTAYAMGTLSFLSTTSVDNEKSVGNITKDPFNVVITGLDVSGTIDEQGRSDVNMILTINPSTGQLLMTSIPRDYEIRMPDKDYAVDKLTHTGFYGVPSTLLAEEDLLELTANYYVKVNFTTVEKFIDAIGGIDVYSEYEFNPVKMKDWTVQEGWNHMNGKQALAFARERKAFPTGDNQRIKNQQAVFEAMFKKATSSRTMLLNYNKILTNLKDYFEMNFSSKEIRALVKKQIAKNPDWQIYKNTLVGGDDTLDTYSAGYAYVMTRDEDSIENAKTLINAVLNGQPLEKDEDGKVYVVETETDTETETE